MSETPLEQPLPRAEPQRPTETGARRYWHVPIKLLIAYLLLFGISAYLGWWSPEYLQGRDLWHFTISRMVVPMVMLGVVASFIQIVPASALLASGLFVIGTISAIKREATGEPFQLSDLFLARQSMHLTGYVSFSKWLAAGLFLAALIVAVRNFRFRWWSIPLFALCAGLLSTYRIEAVAQWIHDNSYRIGVENLTFSQAESERMNGIATHLYFSTAGLRLKHFDESEIQEAMAKLDTNDPAPARTTPPPDIFIVLGEAWWRDPSDQQSPIDKLVQAGFSEGQAISPVYGGTTPNAEFEVLTGIPVKIFQSGIIPYQHYLQYITPESRTMPRLLREHGYAAHAFHNFEPKFWLRDQIYPLFGFASFDSMDDMTVQMQGNGWPTDHGLYQHVLEKLDNSGPQFNFLVTVATHGPFAADKAHEPDGHPGTIDYHTRLSGAVDDLVAFESALRQRGRPYVLLVFGDHLPGLRLHQWKIGIKSEGDPRLHQVPFLVSSNSEDPKALVERLAGRPLYCFSPVLTDWLRIGINDRYFRHVDKHCSESADPQLRPDEAVLQNQMFSATPQL